MASYNRVILVGNLTRDIELRYTPAGTAVMDNALAVNDRRKTASGEWVEEATFVDVTFWGRTAEVASEYLSKGSPVLVEGRLKLDQWETDGQKRSKLRVICERMQMLGSGGGSSGGSRGRGVAGHDDAYDDHDSDSHRGPHQSGPQSAPRLHAGTTPPGTTPPGTTPPGNRQAQPTGDGPGYDDPEIPF
jgi:single-strand DNA-binding protein